MQQPLQRGSSGPLSALYLSNTRFQLCLLSCQAVDAVSRHADHYLVPHVVPHEYPDQCADLTIGVALPPYRNVFMEMIVDAPFVGAYILGCAGVLFEDARGHPACEVSHLRFPRAGFHAARATSCTMHKRANSSILSPVPRRMTCRASSIMKSGMARRSLAFFPDKVR